MTAKGRAAGTPNISDPERKMLLSHCADYMLFGLEEQEMITLLSRILGRPISERSLYNLKKEVRQRQGSADDWLDKYARADLAIFYRRRIEELQYLQTNLFLILDQEKKRGGIDKINIYRYNTIAKTIIENSKVLAEFGMAPPIIAKIKELLPIDINDLNNRVERQKSLAKDVINIKDDDVVETPEALSENEQSELDRIREQTKQAKSAIGIDFDNEDDGRTSNSDNSTNSDQQRVF